MLYVLEVQGYISTLSKYLWVLNISLLLQRRIQMALTSKYVVEHYIWIKAYPKRGTSRFSFKIGALVQL